MTTNEAKPNESGPQIMAMETYNPRQELEELMALLEKEPGLCQQLLETLKSGRWLITLHAKVKDSPPDDLVHHQTHCNYPSEEIDPSLDFVKTMFSSRLMSRPSSRDWR